MCQSINCTFVQSVGLSWRWSDTFGRREVGDGGTMTRHVSTVPSTGGGGSMTRHVDTDPSVGGGGSMTRRVVTPDTSLPSDFITTS
jgi:hypothetical protein